MGIWGGGGPVSTLGSWGGSWGEVLCPYWGLGGSLCPYGGFGGGPHISGWVPMGVVGGSCVHIGVLGVFPYLWGSLWESEEGSPCPWGGPCVPMRTLGGGVPISLGSLWESGEGSPHLWGGLCVLGGVSMYLWGCWRGSPYLWGSLWGSWGRSCVLIGVLGGGPVSL